MLFVILLVVAVAIAAAITRMLQAQKAKNETVVTVKEVKVEEVKVEKPKAKTTEPTKTKEQPKQTAKTSAKKK